MTPAASGLRQISLKDLRHLAIEATGPRLHGNPRRRQVGEPLLDGLRRGPEATSTNDLSILVERAVMAPDIPKVDADRHLELGLPAWDFRDEMILSFSANE
jgi:hypothetical protein